MVNSITFENFRGLKKLELPELSQITLLTGQNNAGKSSVLEGIYLTCTHVIPGALSLVCGFRGLQSNHFSNVFDAIFHNLNVTAPVIITKEANGNFSRLVYEQDQFLVQEQSPFLLEKMDNIPGPFSGINSSNFPHGLIFHFTQEGYSEEGGFSLSGNPPRIVVTSMKTSLENNRVISFIPAYYIGSGNNGIDYMISEWIGQLELQGKKTTVINALNMIEPSIHDFSMIVRQGQAELYAYTGEKLIPFKLMGEGTNKLLHILLAILENPNSVILIDEVEAGFYYDIQKKLWSAIAEAARERECQIIAATHSYECIQNAVDGIAEAGMEDSFCLYRLERKGEENRAFRLSGDLLHYSIDANMEVR